MSGFWPGLVWAQLRSQPLRAVMALLALAFGVALFTAVHLVNAAALGEFEQAARRLSGDADVIVRGTANGFPEALYASLAQRSEVQDASPVLEVDVAMAGQRQPLRVIGLDTFRATRLQPRLAGDIAGDYLGLFGGDRIWLSETAARELGVSRGSPLRVMIGAAQRDLDIRGILPAGQSGGRFGIMDIASAQWMFGRVGSLNRVDLRLIPGIDVKAFRQSLAITLPAGIQVSTPEMEVQRAATLTRSYRVNIAMLALVSILTGALLLFATQSLSVLRRRSSLALLRALGVTRGALRNALLAEGLLLGAIGSLLGILLGYLLAVVLLTAIRGSPDANLTAFARVTSALSPWLVFAFFAFGTVTAGIGAWLPAVEAARRAPAAGLKSGDAEVAVGRLRPVRTALAFLVSAGVLALLPAAGNLPVFGYASIAALLGGGLLLVPSVTAWLVACVPASGKPALDAGLAQVRGGIGQLGVSLAPVILSFSLMVAMSIMVYSFRQSFDHWLDEVLPADLLLRGSGSQTRLFDEREQRAMAAVEGIERLALRRQLSLLPPDGREPLTLIAQDGLAPDAAGESGTGLAIVTSAPVPRDALPPVWISEAVSDLYGIHTGDTFSLPLQTPGGAHPVAFFVAGTVRDYGRSAGAVFMSRADYLHATADTAATEAAFWLAPHADPAQVESRIRRALGDNGILEIRRATEVRELSMRAFDRAFMVTYALEAVAVLIGLAGIACAGAATALARRGEFGMLRHIGMLRRQVIQMLAAEGLLVSTLAALYGLVLGGAISLVLVQVVNRQSFHWSIDLAVPIGQLAIFAAALIAAATVTNVVSARAALGRSALHAVREDW